MKNPNQTGYTLYELLITTLVVGVLLSIGIPSFNGFTQNSRMAASVNDLLGSFQVARSEAARSKDNVSICASADSTTANPTCGGGYGDGWIVFQDPNGNAQFDAGDVLLRSHPALSDEITVTVTDQGSYFSYGPTGLGRSQAEVGAADPPTTTAIFCDDRGNVAKSDAGNPDTGGDSAARVLRVLPIGRAALLRTVDQVEEQGGCP